jgi:hypothetical protein
MDDIKDNLYNGGFPPIKICNINKNNISKFSKERFAPGYKTNINITKILNTRVKKPILLEEINEIEIIEEV